MDGLQVHFYLHELLMQNFVQIRCKFLSFYFALHSIPIIKTSELKIPFVKVHFYERPNILYKPTKRTFVNVPKHFTNVRRILYTFTNGFPQRKKAPKDFFCLDSTAFLNSTSCQRSDS